MTDEVKGRLSGGTDRVPPKREVDRARARADWRWDVAAAGARPRRRCLVGAQLLFRDGRELTDSARSTRETRDGEPRRRRARDAPRGGGIEAGRLCAEYFFHLLLLRARRARRRRGCVARVRSARVQVVRPMAGLAREARLGAGDWRPSELARGERGESRERAAPRGGPPERRAGVMRASGRAGWSRSRGWARSDRSIVVALRGSVKCEALQRDERVIRWESRASEPHRGVCVSWVARRSSYSPGLRQPAGIAGLAQRFVSS